MLVYWLMFLLPAGYAFLSPRRSDILARRKQPPKMQFAWICVFIALTLVIGYRFKVGGDWTTYLHHLSSMRYKNMSQVLDKGDPAYNLLNLLSIRQDWGISGVNFVCALLFSLGLVVFCRALPLPWLALAVAMPYMVTVVAMGYTRQGVALGLVMMGLEALTRKKNLWFVVWVICAATFHKSAILLLPIAVLAATRNRFWTAVWVGVVGLFAYFLLLDNSVDALYINYVEAKYGSQGAIIRTAMNLVPACIYLVFAKRFHMPLNEAKLWRWFSIISIVLFGAAVTTTATTAVDRVALYMLPLQLVVFAYIPGALGKRGGVNTGLTSLILLFYGTVLFVWLNFAATAFAWLPYRFYPLEAWF
jgi:hypothetical protein